MEFVLTMKCRKQERLLHSLIRGMLLAGKDHVIRAAHQGPDRQGGDPGAAE